ncbi:type I glyceraldehyde-3-phosphate dehydrogenase [Cognatazoarcus halotolerans]|uniref:type I glyceraldehyde-3-phosphate dehydrogenase n=1 Tax=Cognatazoarcus halotolerans TaxID=2686016 RepID=UPI001359DA0C|nr:glyceraldehyde 3-phosphate dehydrogenase NAD-binding domain-containing protein [Cognatazoarcus halotolerans]MCP5310135.1 erythrose-4-phosphate dehydrogenase [Zoogloeaceae bacterium]
MSFRIAINGYGRIGRCFLRALRESPLREQLAIVAINEPADVERMAYLTRFDSTHGPFPGSVELTDGRLMVDGAAIAVSHATTPAEVNWRALEFDLLVEASGRYRYRRELDAFLEAGCPRVLLSHPGSSAADVDKTIVYGMNHESIVGDERVVSAASCTTNAIVPILAILEETFGIEHALTTTLHSVMNDQPLIDGYHHTDLRMTRSAMQSMIPVDTGLAVGVARLLPSLAGRIEAKAIRVPVPNVSAIDLVVTLSRDTSRDEINALLRRATNGGVHRHLAWIDHPSASIDFNHSKFSAIVDGSQTRVSGKRMVNLLVWFDNEWAFVNRMLEIAAFWSQRLAGPSLVGGSR